MVGALLLNNIPNILTLVLVPLFVASWWQDWRSARTASSYFSSELVGFDALTAANYVGLVDGWRRSVPHDALLSTTTLVHWTAVFVIYIAWNLAILRKADGPTQRAFLSFSVAEVPLVAIGVTLVAAQATRWTEPRWLQPVGIITLAVSHVALLILWRLMSRRGQ